MFIGMIPGALIWGKLVDRLGRRTSLILSLALYWPLPLLSAFATSFEMLMWLRGIGGLVLSGALVVTFPYFEELVPVRSRGRATVYLSAGWPLGVLAAIGVTTLFIDLGWRWAIGFSALSGLWAIVVYKLVPESPYWLSEKGRTKEAEAAISRLSTGLVTAKVKPMVLAAHPDGKASFFDIFRARSIRITLLQTVINFCFSWGYWALTSWMPLLLAKKGLSAPQGLSFMALSALFMFPGYIAASYLTGKFGRKKGHDSIRVCCSGDWLRLCKLGNTLSDVRVELHTVVLQPGCMGRMEYLARRDLIRPIPVARVWRGEFPPNASLMRSHR